MSLGTRLFTLFEGVAIAFESIRANKVRASLTILGVAVGVFVVVAMSSAVHGINKSVAEDLESAGPTTFFVFRRPIELSFEDDSDAPWRRNPPLRLEEVQAIGRLASVKAATAQLGWRASFKYRDRLLSSASLDATTANWTEVDGGDIYPGRSFTAAEAANGARVLIVNDKLAEALFGEMDPIDKVVDVNGVPFTVIGVHHFAASFLTGGDQPKGIMPLESARRHVKVGLRGLNATVKPRDGATQAEVMDDVTALLRGMRGLRPSQDNTFALVTSDRLMEVYNGFFGVFFVIMIALSAVGLLVGGVGVVAIMMISVTERTREIGVRKALGATRATILWQFLVEAATLTSIGAAIGLVAGGLVALAIRNATSIPAETPPMAIVAALGASALTGIVFGMLPAARAARLDPVEALRYE
ncbi:MAG TPA: ABC transporter permease [Gemmatimonadaceae bacterium]|nr:ABC transporter permease [Gemmatimonadaceae bacterium]